MGRPVFIESRHEVKIDTRIADVRPFSSKAAEWLSDKFNVFVASLPALFLGIMFPILLPFVVISFLGMFFIHLNYSSLLPYRYPVGSKDPKRNKPGEGIFFMGTVRSSNPFERLKQVWLSDDDLRKHMLILGATGSGKSETLKAIFFNALAWSSGFFVADGKADSKLPNDVYTMARSLGRDMDFLALNFLLGGSTPEQIRKSRRRRSNKINPFSSADADTIIQMMSNMLPKVEGEGKNWQEKALNLLRSLVIALCYKRDTAGFELSVSTFIEYLALPKVEELYAEGYREAERNGGQWSYGYNGIKAYLESGGCPGFKIDKLMAKFKLGEAANAPDPAPGMMSRKPSNEQDNQVWEQHSYRSTQLLPVMNLLDKTYGFIFKDKYPEIDMIDVTLNNRILVMLIPSLEKSAQEAENLGKLAIACLRVMMGKNLGSEIEGSKTEIQDSKATNSPYPYVVALDELGYYFADGIAVMFAQARSLGFYMVAAAQDLKKLTEGSREAEAGAMTANTTSKFFMRIEEQDKTMKLVTESLGKAHVATYRGLEHNGIGWQREQEVSIQEIDRVNSDIMQKLAAGQGILNAAGHIEHMDSLYIGKDIEKHQVTNFYINRFLQVPTPSDEEVLRCSIDIGDLDTGEANHAVDKGEVLMRILRSRDGVNYPEVDSPMLNAVAGVYQSMGSRFEHIPPLERGIAYFEAARAVIEAEWDAANVRTTVHIDDIPAEDREERSGASIVRADRLADPEGVSTGEIVDMDPAFGRSVSTKAAGMMQSQPSTEDMVDDPLQAIDTDPFKRKSLDNIRAAHRDLRSDEGFDDASDLSEPQLDKAFDSMFQGISRRSIFDITGKRGTQQNASTRVLHSIDTVTGQLQREIVSDGGAVWIEEALNSHSALTSMSPDDTVVGFSDPVLQKIATVEERLGSVNPDDAAKRLESVIAVKITPNTTPKNDPSSQKPDLDALFSDFDDMK